MKIANLQLTNSNRKRQYKFSKNLNLDIGDYVLIDSDQGLEVALVESFKEFDNVEIINSLKPILSIASQEDLDMYYHNLSLVDNVVSFTNQKIKELDLDMIVLNANFTLDKQILTVYFKAEQRVDFRELVRELSREYQTRIELRQVGARDVAKMIGGIGPCGLVLCCNKFIGEFDAVTIKMAKNQELSLNPRNISGICGKLLCCLKYEDEVYDELKMLLPDLGSKVETEKGLGKVSEVNFIGQKVKVKYFDEELTNEWVDYRLLKD